MRIDWTPAGWRLFQRGSDLEGNPDGMDERLEIELAPGVRLVRRKADLAAGITARGWVEIDREDL